MSGIPAPMPHPHPKLDADNRLVIQIFLAESGTYCDHVVPDHALPYWARKIADALLYRCETSWP
jgi:hypothetical protein